MTARSRSTTLAVNAAGIATALAFLAEEAEAAIQVFTPDPSPFSGFFTSFNPTTDAISSCSFSNFANVSGCTATQPEFTLTAGNNGLEGLTQTSTTALDAGVTLTTSDFSGTTQYAAFPNGTDSFYLGFSFRAFGSSDAYNLGWVELSYGSFTVSVTQWAYEDVAGQSIVTGAVPEPATTAIIAGGVALGGCLVARHFKSKRQEA